MGCFGRLEEGEDLEARELMSSDFLTQTRGPPAGPLTTQSRNANFFVDLTYAMTQG